MQAIMNVMNVRRAVLVVGLGLLGVAAPAVAQTCQWSSVGGGTIGVGFALTVFDDGTGPALYGGGYDVTLNHIAKWDGAQWSSVGSGLGTPGYYVMSLRVFDDGMGPALYAGGYFTTAGDLPVNNIAKWNGAQWSPVGSGLGTPGYYVTSLRVFDDGMGPALYAAGYFTTAGDLPANSIAKWDGMQWSPLGGGLNSVVWELTVFDDGMGQALYAGGVFSTAGGVAANRIAKWSCQ